MQHYSVVVVGVSVFLFLESLFFPIFGASKDKGAETKIMPPVFVETIKVVPSRQAELVSAPGTLISLPGTTIKAEIAGMITKVYFKSGSLVAQGALLFELNSDSINAQLAGAAADLKLNKVSFDRLKSLYKTRAVSKADLDLAKSKYEVSQAKYSEVTALVPKVKVKAPFAGKLGLSVVDIGDYVTPGQSVVVLQTIDPLKIDFSIPEIYLSKVAVGQKLVLKSDAYPEKTFAGTVEAIDALINRGTRTLSVRGSIANSEKKLLPGGFAEVMLQLGEKSVLAVPQTAIVYENDGVYVYKLKASQAEKVRVVLGEKGKDNVVVKEGLKAGDTIITAGQLKIYPGAPIIVANNNDNLKE